ncbi:hypothetical protein BDW59DRAFT_157804 [Aspergillus cavernicola]|uniref:Uncharacterized protein n=1 Tax=Aspergillus cavernicola TaxID=176166 RepID=A0ABR4IUE9_9EURO
MWNGTSEVDTWFKTQAVSMIFFPCVYELEAPRIASNMILPTLASGILKGLSAIAFLSIWGVMVTNGTLTALLYTAWSGTFPDGTVLKTSYTGIWPLDFPVRVLVVFFFGLQSMEDLTPFLMLVDLVAALLVINMMTVVESRRFTTSKWLKSSLLWQYLWNCAGVALILPIYSRLHLEQHYGSLLVPRIPIREAQALPFTAIVTLLLPIPLLAPGLSNADPLYIQYGCMFYLLTPAIGVIFQSLASIFISKTASPSKWFTRPVKTAYLITGTASALTHLGVLSCVLFSETSDLAIISMYLPNHNIVEREKDNILTTGALLFFQWDYIITNLVVIAHGAYLLHHATSYTHGHTYRFQRLLVELVALVIVLGPGAGLAFVLVGEEDRAEIRLMARGGRPYA